MPNDYAERRRFPRMTIAEDARALDLNGAELGRVFQVSGGGMLIQCSSQAIADRLVDDGELRIMIVEPRSQAMNSFDVAVRYREGCNIGLEFRTLPARHAASPALD